MKRTQRRSRRGWCLFVAALVLGGALLAVWTTVGQSTRFKYAPKPRIAWTGPSPPEVVIFAVSGRCGLRCNAPDANREYLTETGATEQIAGAFHRLGLSTYVLAYRAHLFNAQDRSRDGNAQYGFLQLEADFDWARRNWPTSRRVLLGHSHGVNWTHNLLRLHPGWTVDYLIDLDGVCLQWEKDNSRYFEEYYAWRGGNPWRLDPSKSCNIEPVPSDHGPLLLDVKDVVYPGARSDLEVRTAQGPVRDRTPNRRPDGSTRGLFALVTGESHPATAIAGTKALDWVARTVLRLEEAREPSK